MTLYNVRSNGKGFKVNKFDNELEVEASYELTASDTSCTCPSRKRPCKHSDILDIFQILDRVDEPWFYDYKFAVWYMFDWANGKLITESKFKPKWRKI